MKVYIDGLFYKGSGIGRYYEALTKEFAKRGIKIFTCIPQDLKSEFEKDFFGYNNIQPLFVDYKKFSLSGFFKHANILKNIQREVDLFFFPHINLPYRVPSTKNIIITVHDLIPLSNIYKKQILKRTIFYFLVRRAVKISHKIICVSNSVADELLKIFPQISHKIQVIYEFVDDKFVNQNLQIKKRIINEPYILFVGNRKKHKNLEILLRGFSKIKDKMPHYLVIAGSKDKEKDEIDILVEKLNLQQRVIQYVRPSDEIILNLYKFADLFIFPSLIEGFGLPPCEAVSMGCPVILSDIPVLKEIFGDSGFYFNPYDENDLADSILKVIFNSNLKNQILLNQKKRIEIFSKEKIIEEYIKLFESVINSKNESFTFRKTLST